MQADLSDLIQVQESEYQVKFKVDQEVSRLDIEDIIKTLLNRKAPGLDGI